jgi:hypothetical protein
MLALRYKKETFIKGEVLNMFKKSVRGRTPLWQWNRVSIGWTAPQKLRKSSAFSLPQVLFALKLPSHGTRFCMRCFCGGVRLSIAPLRKSIAYIARRPQKHREFFEHVQKIRARQDHALATEQGRYRSDSSEKAPLSVRLKFCPLLLRSRL